MKSEVLEKIRSSHLERDAYLYIRQSTVRQVFENIESTERQYALRQRAVALGWPEERIIVIDSDLSQSGSGSVEREGFQKLVTEVGMGRVGIVLGLEVSRLARNSADWHRLVEFCALTDTLILDEDGVYDPAHFNDRLLLGLKGTMSEAELHVLRSRLRGGLLNKARRGELRLTLPVGFIYDSAGKIVVDPDRQVQETVKLFFATFKRLGGLYATAKHFRTEGIQFPMRMTSGPNKGRLAWRPLSLNRASHLLHNPIYAGAYVYGRSRWRKQLGGQRKHEHLSRDKWQVFIKDHHQGYITWEEFEHIERQLQKAYHTAGFERKSAPREGPALLQGLVVCGICGSRMHVNYYKKAGQRYARYVCWGRGRNYTDPMCQTIIGTGIDAAISDLVLEKVKPTALEVSLAVQEEISQRSKETDVLRQRQVQRAQYEADKARQHYIHVDPANRLVADSLEAEWNEKLRQLDNVKEEVEQQRIKDHLVINEEQCEKIMNLATDFPGVWNDLSTLNRERKKMLALLIEDITLIKEKQISAAVRFRGGAAQTLTLPRPLTYNQLRTTNPEVRKQIDHLLDEYTDTQIAQRLNEQGLVTGAGATFNTDAVKWIRYTTKLKSFRQRLQDSGWVTCKQLCDRLGVNRTKLGRMRLNGEVKARICSDNGQWLYWPTCF